jgi:predicted phosphodiesterase
MPKIDELTAPHRALEEKVKQLEAIVAKQHEHIDRLHKAKFVIPKSKRTLSKGTYCRVAIPDTHGSKCDKLAVAAMIADLQLIQPREIVLLGDHIDCGGFLAQHHTLGYVAESDYSYEEYIAAANTFLDQVQSSCPNASIHYLAANHEERIERYCLTMALRKGVDAKFLYDRLSPEAVLNLHARGIPYYHTGTKYADIAIPGTIKLGKCYFTHGTRTGPGSTSKTLDDFSACVVHGHTHTAAFASKRTVHHGGIGAWCPGCLCELQPLWRHSAPTNWSHGYGLQLVRPDEGFLHINIPIIDHVSYLSDLVTPILKRKK